LWLSAWAGTGTTVPPSLEHGTARLSADRAVPGRALGTTALSGTARRAAVPTVPVPRHAVPNRARARAMPGGTFGKLYLRVPCGDVVCAGRAAAGHQPPGTRAWALAKRDRSARKRTRGVHHGWPWHVKRPDTSRAAGGTDGEEEKISRCAVAGRGGESMDSSALKRPHRTTGWLPAAVGRSVAGSPRPEPDGVARWRP
jgi:hypothetical protein